MCRAPETGAVSVPAHCIQTVGHTCRCRVAVMLEYQELRTGDRGMTFQRTALPQILGGGRSPPLIDSDMGRRYQ